jgi:hypothetical protein
MGQISGSVTPGSGVTRAVKWNNSDKVDTWDSVDDVPTQPVL